MNKSQKQKTLDIYYLESPLQILSSTEYLNNKKNKHIYLFNKSNQTKNISKNFQKNSKKKEANNLLFYFFSLIHKRIFYKVENIGMGDIRSFRGILLALIFSRSDIVLFDDGTFSIFFDRGGSYRQNLKYGWLKSFFIERIIKQRNIIRVTTFEHHIDRNYKSIIRNNLKNAIKILSLNAQNEKELDSRTLYYIESSLEGWVSFEYERSIYEFLDNYCKEHMMKLKVLLHRNTDKKFFEKLIHGISLDVYQLDYPVEIFFVNNDHKNSNFAFCLTTASITAMMTLEESKVICINPDLNSFNPKFRDFAKKYFKDIETFSKKSRSMVNIINI